MAEAMASSPEARKAQIDQQAVATVANSPEFIARLNLPPIPPSPDRPHLVEHRNALVSEMVKAAAEGKEGRFREIARELGLGENANRTLYTDTRSQFLQKREELLVAEVKTAIISESDQGRIYWMGQLWQNIQERCRLDGAPLETRTVEILTSISRGLRQAGNEEFNARMEDMLYGALDAGFPIRAVFTVCEQSGVGGARSELPAETTIRRYLARIAKNRVDLMIERCGQLYAQRETSPGAEMEFRRAYNQLLRMTEGLTTSGTINESSFANKTAMGQLSTDIANHIDPYAVPKGYK